MERDKIGTALITMFDSTKQGGERAACVSKAELEVWEAVQNSRTCQIKDRQCCLGRPALASAL
jgi:hypothetical protein